MGINEAIENTMHQLCNFVRDGHLRIGTSATAGVAEVEINGKMYEVQIRLEGKEDDFIGQIDIVQAAVLGGTIRTS
jgi:hypothetical protein